MNIRRRAARLLAFLVALVLAAGLVAASPAPPAVAAAQDLHIAMMSESSTTTVGTPITLRARVDLGDDEGPIRAAGWAVQFQSLNSDDAVVWTSPTVLTNTAGEATYEYRRTTPGTETIRAKLVTTGCDNTVSDPRTFRWQQAPIAAFVVDRVAGRSVHFDASSSSDPDGTIDRYEWNFGDEDTGTGEEPTHPYREDGTYTVTLTVTDNDGATASVTNTVVVPNAPPIAAFVNDITTWNDAHFDASASSDPDGQIVSFDWVFNDDVERSDIRGNEPNVVGTGSGARVWYTFPTLDRPGGHLVTLTVTDDRGATSSLTKTVTIPNQPPNGFFRAAVPPEGLTVPIVEVSVSDPDGWITSYDWNFGDGTTSSLPSPPPHTYPRAGEYSLSLTVTDNRGAKSLGTRTFTLVAPAPPPVLNGLSKARNLAKPVASLVRIRPKHVRQHSKAKSSTRVRAGADLTDPPIDLALSQSLDRSRTGSVVRLSAKASTTNPQQALAGWQVVFRGTAGGGWVSPPVTTDARGVAEYQRGYKGKATDETITAELIFPACHNIDSNSLDHEWWQPAITLTPTDGQSVVGSSFTLKARLTGADTSPIRNVPLKMTANPSSGATLTREDETDPNGWASFTWIRNAPVTEKILVEELTDDAVPATARTTHRWTKLAEKLTVAASPESSSGRTGSSFWVDVTARMGGHNQAGIAIELTATKAGDSTLTRSTATGPDSHAAFNYTRKKAGGERILVTARFADQTASTTLTRIWKAPKPKVAMTFGPNGTKSEVGTSFEPTATITRAGKPVSGAWVEFSGKLTGSPDAEDSLATDSEGNARFGYSRSTPGTETVTAKAVIDGVPLTRSLVHTWTEQKPKEPAVIDLETETAVPNGDLPISGAGCLPGQQVKVSIGGTKAGSTTADGRGRFKTRVVVPELPLGTHTVRVSCGSVKAEKDIDVNGPQTTKTSVGAKGLATAGFLLSFTMLAGLLLRIGGSRIG